MKRLLLVAAAMLLAVSAFAADAADRDVLITSDGTVYSIASERSEDGLSSSLVLTVQAGDKTTHTVIPESNSGVNDSPTLAYDGESKALFVVWSRVSNAKSSELLVTNYKLANDRWEPATVIDSGRVVRSNVTIRFTRQVPMIQRDGTYADASALMLHAAWWQKAPSGAESPFYAVMALNHGLNPDPDVRDLTDLVSDRDSDEPASSEFLHHVALLAGSTPNSVDAVFADPRTSSFYRLTLTPIINTRVHITVGVKGPKLGGPKTLSFDWSGRTGTISSDDGNTLIFTNTTADKVRWLTLRNGEWLPLQELVLSNKVTVEAAMAALAKMAASAE